MTKASFVFKVERPQVAFEAQLSNGNSVNLTYLAPNARQLKEIQNIKSSSDEIEATEKLLRESVVGEKASEFIDDLLENGSLVAFMDAMNSRLIDTRKAKTKN